MQSPLRHKVIDGHIDPAQVRCIAGEIAKDRGKWVTYNNDAEKKTTCNDVLAFGDNLKRLVAQLQGEEFYQNLEQEFGIGPLQSDPLLHGGGIHISGPGGLLNVHLDYAKHPRLPLLERRLNAILYLTPEWREEWGGATVLTKPDGCTVTERVYPAPGRLFVFVTDDLSYHGVEPVTCPENVERITLATYYLSHIRQGCTRERALFVPRR